MIDFCKKILSKIYYKSLYYYWKSNLKSFGIGSKIIDPLYVQGTKNIIIGSDVLIQHKSWLAALPLTGSIKSELIIEDKCVIGHFNEIFATKSIILEKNVLTADRVYISDNLHGYTDVNMPIMNQPIIQNGTGLRIGEGSWIGVGVAILGANIGKHCVIGANSVVTKDIPDYSVAVGIPAKVIKHYDQETQKWVKD